VQIFFVRRGRQHCDGTLRLKFDITTPATRVHLLSSYDAPLTLQRARFVPSTIIIIIIVTNRRVGRFATRRKQFFLRRIRHGSGARCSAAQQTLYRESITQLCNFYVFNVYDTTR